MTTGETLGAVFPISVSFVQGEQPDSGKFSGWANQTDAGLTRLAKGMGDLWGVEFEDNRLYTDWRRPPHIMNLARLIGPASAINPMRPVAPATRIEYDVEIDPGDIPDGVNEFNLRTDCDCSPPLNWSSNFPLGTPIVDDSIETVLEAITAEEGDSVFVRHMDGRTLLVQAGDYYVDLNGNVFTWSATGNYSGGTPVTYQTTMVPDMYDQATLNVIPDMNQTTSDGLCDVLDETKDANIPSGEYVIRTPYIVRLPRRNASNAALVPGDDGCPPATFATTERARLPYALKAADGMNLSDGDTIPDGFLGLWEEGVGLVLGLTFKLSDVAAATDPDDFNSNYCVIATGGTLTPNAVSPVKGTKYRLITVGTTITELLSYLVRRVDTHGHDDRRSGYPVSHTSLTNNHINPDIVSSKWSITVTSPQSLIAGNHHPQYLMRYGTNPGMDPGQQDNAMLGPLVMANNVGDDFSSVDDYYGDTADSMPIMFGDVDVRLFRDKSLQDIAGVDTLSCTAALCTDSDSAVTANLLMGSQASGKTGLEWKSANAIAEFAFFTEGSVADAGIQAGRFLATDDDASLSSIATANSARLNYNGVWIHRSGVEKLHLRNDVSKAYLGAYVPLEITTSSTMLLQATNMTITADLMDTRNVAERRTANPDVDLSVLEPGDALKALFPNRVQGTWGFVQNTNNDHPVLVFFSQPGNIWHYWDSSGSGTHTES